MSNLLLGFVDVYPKRKRMRRQVPTSSWTCQSGLLPPRLLPFTWTHWDGKYIIKYMKIHENASKYMENTWKYMKSWKYMNISSLRFHPLHARFLEFLRTADLDPSRSLASPWSLQDAVYKHIWFVSLDVKPEHLSWWINVPLNQSTVISMGEKKKLDQTWICHHHFWWPKPCERKLPHLQLLVRLHSSQPRQLDPIRLRRK